MPSLTRDKSRFPDFIFPEIIVPSMTGHWSQLLLSPITLGYLAMECDSAYVCGAR
jgi:hypothetical protein